MRQPQPQNSVFDLKTAMRSSKWNSLFDSLSHDRFHASSVGPARPGFDAFAQLAQTLGPDQSHHPSPAASLKPIAEEVKMTVCFLSTLLREPPASALSTLRVGPCGVATGLLPLVYPSRELARMVLHVSWSLPFHLPAALRSTGITPLHHYYGDSDCCPAPLARIPARTALNAST